ncbi:hypothetical protein ACJ3XI_08925 [Litorimonas sp. RW-G-Af-16]|uniref:hypothetical protein n=1 Tax=Litorimonas sp. RW-G-Af-16 TaxID=3241168 RepID=UPI00390C55B3
MRKYAIIITTAITAILPMTVQARPVSYPDAWTLMIRNDTDQNSLHAHYTVDTQHSVGLRLRYDREGDFTFVGAQINRLMKRWNKIDSQANIYGRIGVGQVYDDVDNAELRLKRDSDEALFLGLSGDWETRRYFISGAAEYWDNGRFGDYSAYHGRLGIAPYVANTGALHTWFMVEGHHRPENDDKVGASALLRFFKGPSLLEVGVDDQGEPLLNYIHRF